jgi:hypothetical protein
VQDGGVGAAAHDGRVRLQAYINGVRLKVGNEWIVLIPGATCCKQW